MAHIARMPAILAVAVLALAACAGAPVQEMSNARQAIRAARDAGAEKAAPQKLNEAEALLNRAEDSLERRAYREARRNAIAARDKAAELVEVFRIKKIGAVIVPSSHVDGAWDVVVPDRDAMPSRESLHGVLARD